MCIQKEWIYLYIRKCEYICKYTSTCITVLSYMYVCVTSNISQASRYFFCIKFEINMYDETGKSFWHFLYVLFLSCYIHLFSWQFLHWSSQEVWLTGLKPTTVMMIPASSPRVSQAQRSPSMVRLMFVIWGIHYQEMFHQQSLMFIKTNMVNMELKKIFKHICSF